jgi:hypothetical protein
MGERDGHLDVLYKITGPNLLPQNLSVSDLESSSLAGYFRFIRSNLCTRHIPNKLTPRGHHDWPDKRQNRKLPDPTRNDCYDPPR